MGWSFLAATSFVGQATGFSLALTLKEGGQGQALQLGRKEFLPHTWQTYDAKKLVTCVVHDRWGDGGWGLGVWINFCLYFLNLCSLLYAYVYVSYAWMRVHASVCRQALTWGVDATMCAHCFWDLLEHGLVLPSDTGLLGCVWVAWDVCVCVCVCVRARAPWFVVVSVCHAYFMGLAVHLSSTSFGIVVLFARDFGW